MSVKTKLTALANAIRSKTGGTVLLSIDAMSAAVSSIETAAASKLIIRELIDRDSLTELSFPDGLTHIGAYAFAGCASLGLSSIPKGISVIGDWAFSGCVGITVSSVPSGTVEIGARAFNGCTGITNMHLPAGIVSLGAHVFYGCTEISGFTVGAGYDANLPLTSCRLLSASCISELIESFADNGSTGVTRTLNLHPDVYAQLSSETLLRASSKGITITG